MSSHQVHYRMPEPLAQPSAVSRAAGLVGNATMLTTAAATKVPCIGYRDLPAFGDSKRRVKDPKLYIPQIMTGLPSRQKIHGGKTTWAYDSKMAVAGAWSEGFSPFRSSRSISAAVQRSAKAAVARM